MPLLLLTQTAAERSVALFDRFRFPVCTLLDRSSMALEGQRDRERDALVQAHTIRQSRPVAGGTSRFYVNAHAKAREHNL